MNRQVIGVTGSIQSGKSELREEFIGRGFAFVNLNRAGNNLRKGLLGKKDTVYAELGIDHLILPDGKRKGLFYEELAQNPDFHKKVRQFELWHVVAATQRYIEERLSDDQPIIINWEYPEDLIKFFKLDHLLLFEVRESIWLERCKERLDQIGWSHPTTDKDVWTLVEAIGVAPQALKNTIEFLLHPNDWSTVDASANDRGLAAMHASIDALER